MFQINLIFCQGENGATFQSITYVYISLINVKMKTRALQKNYRGEKLEIRVSITFSMDKTTYIPGKTIKSTERKYKKKRKNHWILQNDL